MDPKVWSWTSSPAPGTRVESCEGAVNMESARAWLCYSTSPQLWYSRGSDRALRGALVSQWWSSCTYNVSTQRSSGIGRDGMYEHWNGWRRREPYANHKIIEEEEPQIHKTCRCQGRSPMRATYSIYSYPTSKKVMVMEHRFFLFFWARFSIESASESWHVLAGSRRIEPLHPHWSYPWWFWWLLLCTLWEGGTRTGKLATQSGWDGGWHSKARAPTQRSWDVQSEGEVTKSHTILTSYAQ